MGEDIAARGLQGRPCSSRALLAAVWCSFQQLPAMTDCRSAVPKAFKLLCILLHCHAQISTRPSESRVVSSRSTWSILHRSISCQSTFRSKENLRNQLKGIAGATEQTPGVGSIACTTPERPPTGRHGNSRRGQSVRRKQAMLA